jgi:hypothetical protein
VKYKGILPGFDPYSSSAIKPKPKRPTKCLKVDERVVDALPTQVWASSSAVVPSHGPHPQMTASPK